jgi:crotonobetainyl-CoA:carnitine CoA-transferase CaiB-like acyl-CoA transferase
MTSARRAPLAGVRIVAVEQYGAGPYGTLYLADMGAEVIKIEDPGSGGDIARYVPPGQVGSESLFFESFNRGKRSLAVDLKNPRGREVFERLVARSDAVYSNLRGDQPARLGLTYETLGAINPAIVCCSLSAYGRSGERAAYPGYDALVQAEAGWAALTGEPDGPPVKSGLSMVDYAAGLTAALALMVALFDAKRTGVGRDVDTSLYDVAIGLLTYPATWYLTSGIVTERLPFSAHPSMVPFQFFETADGHIAVACPKEKFFRSLVQAIDLPELLEDPRFQSFATRREHRAALVEILNTRLRERSTDEWLARLRGVVPIAPVRSVEQALDRDELIARDMLAAYPHPTFGTVRTVGTPFTLGGFEPEHRPAPTLDADRRELLTDLGYTDEEAARLGEGGAFGSSVS